MRIIGEELLGCTRVILAVADTHSKLVHCQQEMQQGKYKETDLLYTVVGSREGNHFVRPQP